MTADAYSPLIIVRLRHALAELGFPPEAVYEIEDDGGWRGIGFDPDVIPHAVAYQAGAIVAHGFGMPYGCWSCWVAGGFVVASVAVQDCKVGRCAHPAGPAVPPRELLQRAVTA